MSQINNFYPVPSAKQTRYRYVPIQQTLEHEDIGSYSTFGIQVLLVEETVLDLVSDVSTELDEVQRICELCTERQITPKHILDVVRNHLDEEPDILPV